MQTLRRTPQTIQWIQNGLMMCDIDYTLKHGTYSTTIEHEFGKTKLTQNDFATRVFCASQMIKKDCKDSQIAQQIMAETHYKRNFDFNNNLKDIHYDSCFNIDLSSAYAYCLFNNQIITKKTFDYLLKLPKMDRLTSVGMLATSHVKYWYKKGKCVDFKPFREPTAEIFFFLIEEINYLMQDLKWMLGNDFIFYWVDGIFIKPSVSKTKIQNVENLLISLSYKYKYEKVENFSVNRDEDKVVINMLKNNEKKRYEFGTGRIGRQIGKKLQEKALKELLDNDTRI